MGIVKGILLMEDDRVFKGEFDDFNMKPFELQEVEILMDKDIWKQTQKLKEIMK